jgi:hypothetical protein
MPRTPPQFKGRQGWPAWQAKGPEQAMGRLYPVQAEIRNCG